MRFPALHRALAKAGARLLTVPSAFSVTTGAAHWHTLLRARAIENGCFVVAAAQTGVHLRSSTPDAVEVDHPLRRTYGHSLVVSPWGEILHDSGGCDDEIASGNRGGAGVCVVDIDFADVDAARRRMPSLQHDREYHLPIVSPSVMSK